MKYQITGDNMQAIQIALEINEEIYAEAGAMLYYRGNIQLDSKAKGGLLKSFGRKIFTGESLLMSTFRCIGESGEVAFAAPTPGKIIPIELNGNEFICNKDSYLASVGQIDINITFTKKFGAGLFGGQGFILQKIDGQGVVFLHSGGNFIELELQPNETIMADTGCIVMMQPSVNYDIKYVGGIKKAVFGGEGLFFASLTGPGKIILQTLPFSRLAQELGNNYMSKGGPAGGIVDTFLGSI